MTIKKLKDVYPEPNEDVVAACKQLHERAQAGELRSILFVYETNSSGFCFDHFIELTRANIFGLIGALDCLRQLMTSRMVDYLTEENEVE